MDGGFSGPTNVAYAAYGTLGVQWALRQGDTPGIRREEYNLYGKTVFELKLLTGTVAAGDNVILDTTDTSGNSVKDSTAVTSIGIGVAGAAGVAGQYIWVQLAGVVSVNSGAATIAAGVEVSASATAGAIQTAPYTATTQQGVLGVSVAANSGGFTLVRLQGLQ